MTEHPVNILGAQHSGQWFRQWGALLKLMRKAGYGRLETPVQFYKRVLGRQSCCWVGGSENRRFYIWDGPLWRIYVHNEGGTAFEVPSSVTPENVWEALAAYQQALGLYKG